MTSSELVPAGISSPVTTWSGWSLFQAVTTALPQATSSALFEYQILMAPVAPAALAAAPLAAGPLLAGAPFPPPLSPMHAERSRARTAAMLPRRSHVRDMCTPLLYWTAVQCPVKSARARRLGGQLRVRAASLILARVASATAAWPVRATHPVECRCDRIFDGAMRPPGPS